eukprot:6244826-Alexandrium_andersonii.AAC.1
MRSGSPALPRNALALGVLQLVGVLALALRLPNLRVVQLLPRLRLACRQELDLGRLPPRPPTLAAVEDCPIPVPRPAV